MPDNPFDMHLRPGKLPPDLLKTFLSGLITAEKRVLLGPNVGEDSAFISFGSSTLIAKSDPITFATDEIGWYAVHVNANDIAAMGAIPRFFLSTMGDPENPFELLPPIESHLTPMNFPLLFTSCLLVLVTARAQAIQDGQGEHFALCSKAWDMDAAGKQPTGVLSQRARRKWSGKFE